MSSPVSPVRSESSWIVIDLDGTLCDNTHRLHVLSRQPRNWDLFHSMLDKDSPKPAVACVVRSMRGYGFRAALCTGRPERYRDDTMNWLQRHAVDWDRLLMRPDGNKESDDIVKPALVAEAGIVLGNTLFIMEDRDKMVRCWRLLGFTCFQVQEGAY